MKSTHPELALERILLAVEREVMDATDEELLAAARELGINPSMKGSAAFSGVTFSAHAGLRPREAGEPGGIDSTEAVREQVHAWLAALTPQEAGALRARFGIDSRGRTPGEEELVVLALARELAMLQTKQ